MVIAGRVREVGRLLTITVAVPFAVAVCFRLRRRAEIRSRFSEKLTVILVLALDVMMTPTRAGR